MASSDAFKSMVKGILKCQVCMKVYCFPKSLTCGHTFCQACIQQQLDNSDSEETISVKCPICKERCIIPDGDVSNLKTNLEKCPRHHGDLTHVCVVCRPVSALCSQCESDHKGQGHNFKVLDQSAEWCKTKISAKVQNLKNIQRKLKEVDLKGNLTEESNEIKNMLLKRKKNIIEEVENRKRELLMQMQTDLTEYKTPKHNIQEQLDSVGLFIAIEKRGLSETDHSKFLKEMTRLDEVSGCVSLEVPVVWLASPWSLHIPDIVQVCEETSQGQKPLPQKYGDLMGMLLLRDQQKGGGDHSNITGFSMEIDRLDYNTTSNKPSWKVVYEIRKGSSALDEHGSAVINQQPRKIENYPLGIVYADQKEEAMWKECESCRRSCCSCVICPVASLGALCACFWCCCYLWLCQGK